MDALTLSVAAVAYIGAEVGRKATEETATKVWEQIKLGWKSVFGHLTRVATKQGFPLADKAAECLRHLVEKPIHDGW
jgi:hypothetical protein